MDVVISQPELALEIPETPFVVVPLPVEVDGAVLAFLYDGPAWNKRIDSSVMIGKCHNHCYPTCEIKKKNENVWWANPLY